MNRRFVDVYGGGASLIGREMRVPDQKESARIVGVIGDMLDDGAAAPVMPYVYSCMSAGWWPDPSYVVRTEGDPRTVMAAVRQLVRSLDPGRPVFGVKPLDDVIGDSLDQPRINARLLALFAAAALVLAALGMYGLLMLVVAERRRELGVRMALGAAPIDLIRLVLSGAGRLVISGMAVGLVLTFAAGHAFRAMLVGVAPHDPRALLRRRSRAGARVSRGDPDPGPQGGVGQSDRGDARGVMARSVAAPWPQATRHGGAAERARLAIRCRAAS